MKILLYEAGLKTISKRRALQTKDDDLEDIGGKENDFGGDDDHDDDHEDDHED